MPEEAGPGKIKRDGCVLPHRRATVSERPPVAGMKTGGHAGRPYVDPYVYLSRINRQSSRNSGAYLLVLTTLSHGFL